MSTPADSAAAYVRRINAAWLTGNLDDLSGLLHEQIVMALPGLNGRVEGRTAVTAGFAEFRSTCTVHEWQDRDWQVDVLGSTAVVAFRYSLTYEREGTRYRSAGRDLWLLERTGDDWRAIWRAMLELEESPVP